MRAYGNFVAAHQHRPSPIFLLMTPDKYPWCYSRMCMECGPKCLEPMIFCFANNTIESNGLSFCSRIEMINNANNSSTLHTACAYLCCLLLLQCDIVAHWLLCSFLYASNSNSEFQTKCSHTEIRHALWTVGALFCVCVCQCQPWASKQVYA